MYVFDTLLLVCYAVRVRVPCKHGTLGRIGSGSGSRAALGPQGPAAPPPSDRPTGTAGDAKFENPPSSPQLASSMPGMLL